MNERKDRYSVGNWMTQNPATIEPDTPVRKAFFTMRTQGYRHLLVVDDGALQGIVTDRDLRRPDLTDDPDGWNEYYNLDADYTVRDVMTTDLKSLRPGDKLEKALKLFVDHKFGAVPVLDKNDALIGILSAHDALRAFQAVLQSHGDHVRN